MRYFKKLFIPACSIVMSLLHNTSFAQSCAFTNYTLSPNGAVCTSTMTMTLSGSQTGVTYQLKNAAIGSFATISGTGSAISWANVNVIQNVPYQVVASAGTCSPTVVASATVYNEIAGGSIQAPNGTVLCGGNSINLTIQPTTPGTDYTYQWFVNGAPQNNTNFSTYTVTQPGTYFAVIDNACSGAQLPSVTVTAGAAVSNVTIAGSEKIASGVTSSTYSAAALNSNGIYNWSFQPSTAGSISANGNSATVTWNTSFIGIATISVTADGCGGTTATATYNVDCHTTSSNYNYVEEISVRQNGVITSSDVDNLPLSQKAITYTYSDDIGRPIQKVQQGASGSGKDIVTLTLYDQFGRQAIKPLPYSATLSTSDGSFRSNANYDESSFYNSPASGWNAPGIVSISSINNITPSFSQTNFEPSPLNRIIEQGAPGAAWQPSNSQITSSGHTVKTTYTLNDQTSTFVNTNYNGSRVVNLYSTIINTTTQTQRLQFTGTTYGQGQLFVTITANENWQPSDGCLNTVEEYKDKNGNIVLKRTYNLNNGLVEMLSIYYVYDIYNNLAFVLTPQSKPDGTVAPSQKALDNLCYQYMYDQRNRQVAKKLPGKGWEYSIYNPLDQVVVTQDSLQRSVSPQLFSYTKYDATGRVVQTGIYTVSGPALSNMRSTLQSQVYSQSSFWETYTPSSGYSNSTIPQTNTTVLITNYYDSYLIPGLPSTSVAPGTASSMLHSLLTAKSIAVLNDPTKILWLVNYYDDKGRIIQTYKQHFLSGKASLYNYDMIKNSYDFNDELQTSIRSHFYANATNSAALAGPVITTQYTYDTQGRKLLTQEQLSSGTLITIANNTYNELGQLYIKGLHGNSSGANPLQSCTYLYNERGWLTSSASSLFSFQLQYNSGTNPQYNGNISSGSWTSPSTTGNYNYNYDKLNRLISGITADGKYGEKDIAYDLNGNIMRMNRINNGIAIDDLVYNYSLSDGTNTNQLQSVQDQSTDNSSIGYKAGTWSYSYDANGNMITDNSKGITASAPIVYNMLNLPQIITLPNTTSGTYTLTYVYDGSGNKLRRLITQNSGSMTDYIDGIQYDALGTAQPTISFIQTEQGRITGISSTPNFEYFLSDNLADTRVSFDTQTGSARAVQQDNYLPFGMDVPVQINGANQNYYLYNKKELQQGTWNVYDYGARFYDPVIARWTTLDPLSEKSRKFSPYNYGEDNSIINMDPDGMDIINQLTGQNKIDFNTTIKSLNATSAIFNTIYSSFQNSTQHYYFYSGDLDNASAEAEYSSSPVRNEIDWGFHSDFPYLFKTQPTFDGKIVFNEKFQKPVESASLYEEVFHGYQAKYYGVDKNGNTKANIVQMETEARVARFYDHKYIAGETDYYSDYINDPNVIKYYAALRSGDTKTAAKYESGFRAAINKLAQKTAELYEQDAANDAQKKNYQDAAKTYNNGATPAFDHIAKKNQ